MRTRSGRVQSPSACVRSRTLREALVAELQRRELIRTERVRDAFLEVPRELFVSEAAEREGLEAVYRDEAILTKRAESGLPLSSSSQPAIMAQMLERLALEDGMRVLEVGTGTGYNAALLSLLAGRRGHVVSVDVDAEVAASARRALRQGGYRAHVVVADGRAGSARSAPYDRIIVTASSDTVPCAWFDQMSAGGVLVLPVRLDNVGRQIVSILRRTGRGFRSIGVVSGGFMPLRERDDDGRPGVPAEPCLSVTDFTEGRPESVLHLSGAALGTLSGRAKRRLVATALGKPRRARVAPPGQEDAVGLFLSLTLPSRRRVTSFPNLVGAIGRDGRSLALLEARPNRRGRGILMSYGTGDAEELVLDRVREWRRRGRPTESELAVDVTYDGDRSRLTVRWPTVS